jgi:hypothetical protein
MCRKEFFVLMFNKQPWKPSNIQHRTYRWAHADSKCFSKLSSYHNEEGWAKTSGKVVTVLLCATRYTPRSCNDYYFPHVAIWMVGSLLQLSLPHLPSRHGIDSPLTESSADCRSPSPSPSRTLSRLTTLRHPSSLILCREQVKLAWTERL